MCIGPDRGVSLRRSAASRRYTNSPNSPNSPNSENSIYQLPRLSLRFCAQLIAQPSLECAKLLKGFRVTAVSDKQADEGAIGSLQQRLLRHRSLSIVKRMIDAALGLQQTDQLR